MKPPILKLLRVPNPANEPTLKTGRFTLISRLKKPKHLRLIAYHAITPETGKTLFFHRICGLPGDTIEIKAGVLYVNGINTDENLNLTHTYKLNPKDKGTIKIDDKNAYILEPYPDTLYAPLPQAQVQAHNWPCERHILPPGLRDNRIYTIFKKNWNHDNFGPIRVPKGTYFVLGDNRSHPSDSRYNGFIETKKLLGCVLWK